MDFSVNIEGTIPANEFENEIAEAIKKAIPAWKDSTNENVRDFCGLYTVVEMMVGNKGYTVEQAVKEATS